jgi:septum formation protein
LTAPRLILASASPRRAELLRMLRLDFEIRPADIDETYFDHEEPGAHAERLSREKASAIAADAPDAVVIGSDTVVIAGDTLLGKPRDASEAVDMLLTLQGREHIVATGLAVVWDGSVTSGIERVRVRFRDFDREIARAYVATGEPMDKAGAYGIQGFGATLVERIDGDYFSVMGLPVSRLIRMLESVGIRYAFPGLERTR